MGRGRKGAITQSRKKLKTNRRLNTKREKNIGFLNKRQTEENKILITEQALEFMENMNPQQLGDVLLKSADGFEKQENIDDFILTPTGNQDPQITEYLFRKLYDQSGEDDEVRKILEATFDFSKQKNCCAAMKMGEYLCCGEPCEGMFCNKHLLQIDVLGIIASPCKCCGIGTRGTYCGPCILETGRRERSLRLAKEFEDDEPTIGSYGWHAKASGN